MGPPRPGSGLTRTAARAPNRHHDSRKPPSVLPMMPAAAASAATVLKGSHNGPQIMLEHGGIAFVAGPPRSDRASENRRPPIFSPVSFEICSIRPGW